MHLLDTRFAGIAQGVGTSKILGRVHMVDFKVIGANDKKHSLQVSLTVLEQGGVDFLFGLDNLKRHQCCIDLVDSKLHIDKGSFSVPFMNDGEIRDAGLTQSMRRQSSVSSTQDEGVIKEICDMGFTRMQAEEALRVCGGDKDLATNYLLNNK
jgi:DNA damage-inducible protein 1